MGMSVAKNAQLSVEAVRIRSKLCFQNAAMSKKLDAEMILIQWFAERSVSSFDHVVITACCKYLSFLYFKIRILLCRLCGIDCSDPRNHCMARVTVPLSCGHEKKVYCYQAEIQQSCTERCKSTLECGHPCPGNCYTCNGNRLHAACQEICRRPLVCGHLCKQICSLPCLCQVGCLTRCVHSVCTKVCIHNP